MPLPPVPQAEQPLPSVSQQTLPPVPQQNPNTFSPESIADLWVKNGGDPKVAGLMGHVGFSESAGNPNAQNPTSGAAGLFQINPKAHGQGNWTDVNTNVKQAIALYNARVKQGQTGFEDWFDSKDKGSDGGWGKYLVQHVSTVTPENHTPAPPGVKPVNKPKNGDPRQGNYNVIEQFAGHQDLPFMAFNAKMWDDLDHTGGTHMKDMMDLWTARTFGGKGSPAAASAIYGPNSPQVLAMYERSSNPELKAYADLLKQNPWLPAGATFIEEFFNPMAWAEGGAMGKGLGLAAQGAKMIPGMSKIMANYMHVLSVYKGIEAEHGASARNYLATIGQRMSSGQQHGHNDMMDVFEHTTPDEQLEIRRRQQNLTPRDFGNRNAELDRRATLARDQTRAMTAAKLYHGALKRGEVFGVQKAPGGPTPTTLYHEGTKVGTFEFDPGTYVGLRAQYNHPDPAYNKLLEGLHPAGGASSAGPSNMHKVYDNIDEAMGPRANGDPSLLRGDVDHAEMHRQLMSSGYSRIQFEKGIKELAAQHPDMIKAPRTVAQMDAMRKSGKYLPLLDSRSGVDVKSASPFVRSAWVSPAFRNFLNDKNSMSIMMGRSMIERGGGSDAEKFIAAYNHMYRASIVANPAYHPFWNVAPNATAAAGRTGPHALLDSMLNQTRAMIGAGASVTHALSMVPGMSKVTAGLDAMREGLEHPFLRSANSYQNALKTALQAGASHSAAHAAGREAAIAEAEHAGAGAEFGAPRTAWGGSSGRIFTRDNKGKFQWANSREAMDQLLTRADQWNQEATFGVRGEKMFAVTLFHQLHGKGGLFEGDPNGAAWAVREALGNYRNLDPENYMSKFIMFFPWLASNTAFWFKSLTRVPQFVTAPTQASRSQRENAGDPNAYASGYPHLGISAYDKDSNTNRDLPLPFKDMERVGQAGYDVATGNLDAGIQGFQQEAASRLKPIFGAGLDTLLTHNDERANAPGSYPGYNTMYNKNLPDMRTQQLIQSLSLNLSPLPTPFVTRDILRNGYDPESMSSYIQEAAGMGYITQKEADNYKRLSAKPEHQLESKMSHLRKIQSGSNPMPEDKYNARVKQIEDAYVRYQQTIKARIQAGKQKLIQSGSTLPRVPMSELPPVPVGER